MRTQTRFYALAMVAVFAIAGCGSDNSSNNSNDNTSPSPVRTSTPVGPTLTAAVTATPGEGTPVPTVTATPGEGTPLPTITATPGVGLACKGEGAALLVTLTSDKGSDLDTGWTGISHNSVALYDSVVQTNLDCVGNDCVVDGSALVGKAFGSPLPLSSGGVSACVVNHFREGITGTYNCDTGCSTSSVKLISSIFTVQEASKPCPPCVGDPTPNDGVKGGKCDGGTTPGADCDVGGISSLFQDATNAPPDAGMTSNDCLPLGSSVGELEINLDPLTTGTTTVSANVDCLSDAFPKGSCYCPGQVAPNSCIPDGVCGMTGVCENNKPIGRCSGQQYRACKPVDGNKACEDRYPGAGNCVAQQPPCFLPTITRTGTCEDQTTHSGTLAAIFCVGETDAEAINTVSGLPGPAAVTVPGHTVRTAR